MGMVANDDFTKYDGLHANCRTKYLSAEEVQYITWEMNAFVIMSGSGTTR
jgi:anaerobic magnesium-protoporphyrin IX monomethyl ester cyclase